MRPIVQPCGTRASWARGCHCDACRAANQDYHRQQRIGSTPEPIATGPARPGPWVERAACRGADTNAWFPVRGANTGHLRAHLRRLPRPNRLPRLGHRPEHQRRVLRRLFGQSPPCPRRRETPG